MKSSAESSNAKKTVSPSRRGSVPALPSPTAAAAASTATVEDARQQRSNRPVKARVSGTSRSSLSAETPSTSPRVEAAAGTAPPPTQRSSRCSAPAKPPSHKKHSKPPSDANANSNDNNINVDSLCSSMGTEKTVQRSVPPSLPQHRATTSRDATLGGSEESEASIVESSRSYLTRLSLEDAVVALERLRFLMMSHTAAVTGSQLESCRAAEVLPPQQAHVDPFKLSKRPLEDIAEELCSQLRRLTSAYAVASAADRCLLGVSDSRQSLVANPRACKKPLGSVDAPLPPSTNAAGVDVEVDNTGDLLGSFGPMVSTQHLMTTTGSNTDSANFLDSRLSFETDDSWGVIDLHKPNPGPRIAYPQREDSENGQEFGSTVYKYPNGTVVSYPMSTFGELVSTESGQGTTYRSRGATLLNSERHFLVSDGTQTDDTLEPTKKEKELQAYLRALEGRLTEKQRLEAMRESRGAKKSGISATLSRLAQSAEKTKQDTENQSTTHAHALNKSSHH
ncbi:hypothetical protein N2W54_007064 [Lotmaria passim]